jgi:hypothetical protein
MPYTFRTGGIVDAEAINGNLRAGARDVGRNLSRRYTYCQTVIPITGMVNTDTSAQRDVSMVVPTNYRASVVGVELVIYATAGVTWTLTVSDGTITDTVAVATAGTTTKASGGLTRTFTRASGSAFTFVMSASGASTITAGFIVVHLRCDRGNAPTSATHAGYTPTLLQSTSSSAGSTLDTQLQALEMAVTTDNTNDEDLRVECFLARNFAAAVTWNVPSGAGRTAVSSQYGIVCAAIETVTVAVTSATSGAVSGTGTGNTVTGSITHASRSDAPTTSADDTTVTLTPAGGTVELAYVFVWWS